MSCLSIECRARSGDVDKVEEGRQLEPGYDSHESPHKLEWYLPLDGQSCPMAVLTIKAEDVGRRDFGDDGNDNS